MLRRNDPAEPDKRNTAHAPPCPYGQNPAHEVLLKLKWEQSKEREKAGEIVKEMLKRLLISKHQLVVFLF
ncbi:hypothetical protein ACQ86N_20570 [Puia sp. P3]|uniref:hypothetical protein n=1 Tax=Puia sp. P3 TaxID=3423952 RepID=UPI003D66F921